MKSEIKGPYEALICGVVYTIPEPAEGVTARDIEDALNAAIEERKEFFDGCSPQSVEILNVIPEPEPKP